MSSAQGRSSPQDSTVPNLPFYARVLGDWKGGKTAVTAGDIYTISQFSNDGEWWLAQELNAWIPKAFLQVEYVTKRTDKMIDGALKGLSTLQQVANMAADAGAAFPGANLLSVTGTLLEMLMTARSNKQACQNLAKQVRRLSPEVKNAETKFPFLGAEGQTRVVASLSAMKDEMESTIELIRKFQSKKKSVFGKLTGILSAKSIEGSLHGASQSLHQQFQELQLIYIAVRVDQTKAPTQPRKVVAAARAPPPQPAPAQKQPPSGAAKPPCKKVESPAENKDQKVEPSSVKKDQNVEPSPKAKPREKVESKSESESESESGSESSEEESSEEGLDCAYHKHLLSFEPCPYKHGWSCDICAEYGGPRKSMSWRCDACGFDAHENCARGIVSSGSSSSSGSESDSDETEKLTEMILKFGEQMQEIVENYERQQYRKVVRLATQLEEEIESWWESSSEEESSDENSSENSSSNSSSSASSNSESEENSESKKEDDDDELADIVNDILSTLPFIQAAALAALRQKKDALDYLKVSVERGMAVQDLAEMPEFSSLVGNSTFKALCKESYQNWRATRM